MSEEIILWKSAEYGSSPELQENEIVYDVHGDSKLLPNESINIVNADEEDGLLALINDLSDHESVVVETVATEPVPVTKPAKSKFNKKHKKLISTDEEKHLNKLLFGNKKIVIEKLQAQVDKQDNESSTTSNSNKRKPVWHDSDDDETKVEDVLNESYRSGSLANINKKKTYKEYLDNKFEKIVSAPKWAKLDREMDIDSDEEILQTVGHVLHKAGRSIAPKTLEFKRLRDINRTGYSEGSITGVQFHPLSTVAMVTGDSGMASIYSIDGLKNEKLHNVFFKNFEIKCARILPCGTEALIGGSKNFFYTYDLMKAEETRVFLPRNITKLTKFEVSPCGKYFAVAGRFGEVHLMEAKTKELIHTFKQEYVCKDLKFTNDSKKLITHSRGSELCIFDLRNERIEHKFIDDGCIYGSTVCISPNNSMIATGSNEGVCNIYNYDDIFKSATPTPQKIIYNLQTAISAATFNHTSELLAICSDVVAGAVKIVHFPTGTVFSNFPGFNTNIGSVRRVQFSPHSGFLAMGNTMKQVPLFRLKHFPNY